MARERSDGTVWFEETEDGVVLHMRVGLWVMGQAAVTGQSRGAPRMSKGRYVE